MKKSPEQETKEICNAIGQKIKDVRQKNGLSLQELARRTGFAKSYLSQIENSRREPPISTLTKIAYVLGVGVMFLITGQSEEDGDLISVVRSGERRKITSPYGSIGHDYESVTYRKKGRLLDGYIVTQGFEFPPDPKTHEGNELVFMLEGRQEFVYNGKLHILEQGDCACFDSAKLHYGRSLGHQPAKLLVVYTAKS